MSSLSECPEGKIRNPATNRCVKKDGRIGKALSRSRSRGKRPAASSSPKRSRSRSSTKTRASVSRARSKSRKASAKSHKREVAMVLDDEKIPAKYLLSTSPSGKALFSDPFTDDEEENGDEEYFDSEAYEWAPETESELNDLAEDMEWLDESHIVKKKRPSDGKKKGFYAMEFEGESEDEDEDDDQSDESESDETF